MHDTWTLRTICQQDAFIRRYFLDVYGADQVRLPSNTYYQLPRSSQKGGLVFPQRKKKKNKKRVGARKRRSQKGGLGPLALMAGMSLAPMLLNSLMPQQQRRMPPQHRMPPRRL